MPNVKQALVAGVLLLLSCTSAMAQYPDKPVRLVVPFPPGGPTDLIARVVAVGMAADLGQQVVIDNKGGAGGNVGTDLVAKSKPDGYTLLFGTAATHGINISLYKTLPYHPVRDFEAIALVGLAPMALLVPPGQPRTLKDLIAKLRANPGRGSYPSSGNGTTNHLAGELFKTRTGIDVLHVPYRGTGPALQDLLAGRHAFMFGTLGPVMENIKGGPTGAPRVDGRQPQLRHARHPNHGRSRPARLRGWNLECRGGADRHPKGDCRQAQRCGEQGARGPEPWGATEGAQYGGQRRLYAGHDESLHRGRNHQVA